MTQPLEIGAGAGLVAEAGSHFAQYNYHNRDRMIVGNLQFGVSLAGSAFRVIVEPMVVQLL